MLLCCRHLAESCRYHEDVAPGPKPQKQTPSFGVVGLGEKWPLDRKNFRVQVEDPLLVRLAGIHRFSLSLSLSLSLSPPFRFYGGKSSRHVDTTWPDVLHDRGSF